MGRCEFYRSSLLRSEPDWRPSLPPAPPKACSWLLEPGSLTERLARRFGPVRVVLLRQGIGRLFGRERALIGGPRGWVREVVLSGGDRPLLAARSVGPRSLAPLFAAQGTRPLGERLFSDPGIFRLEMSWSLLSPLFWRAEALPKPRWARRGLYLVEGRPLLVAEFFLFL